MGFALFKPGITAQIPIGTTQPVSAVRKVFDHANAAAQLTNMSTDYIVESLEAGSSPRLVRFLPTFHGAESERRRLSLSTTVHKWLMEPTTNEARIKLTAAARIHFGQFVKGEDIDDLNYMKRVSRRRDYDEFDDEVWSIRPDFRPVYRFLGAFYRADWFVILVHKPRDYFQRDQHWQAQIDAVRSNWDALFPYQTRHRGTEFANYVTFNAEHCDDRW